MHASDSKTIGIVEDDEDTRDIVCYFLEDRGLTAMAYPPNREVLAELMRAPPDVLILDMSMPDIDGITIFLALRAHTITSNLPVIFFTAYPPNLLGNIPEAYRANCWIVNKPNLDQLVARVEHTLRGLTNSTDSTAPLASRDSGRGDVER
jgi:DNA-binding response OmpR family regulator